MEKAIVGLLVLVTFTGPVSSSEYCRTGYLSSTYCTYYCCTGSSGYYDYCCTYKSSYNYDYTSTSTVFAYWIIAPIVIGAIIFIASVVTLIKCCCVTVNGQTRYQSWSSRRVGATTIAMTSSVNQQQSTMNNLPYPQQQYPGYPMYQQPYPMGQQPYSLGPQFGGQQPPCSRVVRSRQFLHRTPTNKETKMQTILVNTNNVVM